MVTLPSYFLYPLSRVGHFYHCFISAPSVCPPVSAPTSSDISYRESSDERSLYRLQTWLVPLLKSPWHAPPAGRGMKSSWDLSSLPKLMAHTCIHTIVPLCICLQVCRSRSLHEQVQCCTTRRSELWSTIWYATLLSFPWHPNPHTNSDCSLFAQWGYQAVTVGIWVDLTILAEKHTCGWWRH